MTANRKLAEQRAISEETCKKIDQLHEEIDNLMLKLIETDTDEESAQDILNLYDAQLQRLWEFPSDSRYFTLFKKYKFKKEWAGRSFKCNTTGIVLTIPNDVGEGEFFGFGQAFVDVGRLGFYSRFSNCSEISKEKE